MATKQNAVALRPRLIDQLPSNRTRPMRVLCMGMCRTGTNGLYMALGKLGYKCYHMVEAIGVANSLDTWREAMDAKFDGTGPDWGRREFDAMLGNYDAVADVPCCLFVDELTEAYPDALVILTNRPVESWLTSMRNSIGVVVSWESWHIVAPWDRATALPWWNMAKSMIIRFGWVPEKLYPGMRPGKFYEEHYAHVRKVVPAERLLEFKSQDGWGPLCKFLDKDVPHEPYPNVNDGNSFIFFHKLLWWKAVGMMVTKIGATVGTPLALAWFWPQISQMARRRLLR